MNRFRTNASIFRSGSVTYYYSSLFFSGQVKEDVFALYAYVRVVDDMVDRPVPMEEEFESLWRVTKASWEGEGVENGLVGGFVKMAKRRGFEWEWIESFWKAMRQDLVKKEYRVFAEVEKYMYGSAEVIGLMMMRILELPEASARFARVQGRAMQWVNFIRDVAEDLSLGRVYMPLEDLRRYKVDIHSPSEESFGLFVRAQIAKYIQMQGEAEEGYKYIPRRYRVPIMTAAQMYDWTALQIDRDPMVVWCGKVRPPVWRVMGRLFINALGGK